MIATERNWKEKKRILKDDLKRNLKRNFRRYLKKYWEETWREIWKETWKEFEWESLCFRFIPEPLGSNPSRPQKGTEQERWFRKKHKFCPSCSLMTNFVARIFKSKIELRTKKVLFWSSRFEVQVYKFKSWSSNFQIQVFKF